MRYAPRTLECNKDSLPLQVSEQQPYVSGPEAIDTVLAEYSREHTDEQMNKQVQVRTLRVKRFTRLVCAGAMRQIQEDSSFARRWQLLLSRGALRCDGGLRS